MRETFFVLVCRICNAPPSRFLPIPFDSAEARGKWAAAHTAGTGHDSWFVHDEERVCCKDEHDGSVKDQAKYGLTCPCTDQGAQG